MAKAKKVPQPGYVVTLELTQTEAEVLHYVTACIGGSDKGPREAMDSIGYALYEVGVEKSIGDATVSTTQTSLYFNTPY